ncbi:MAG: 4-hydroxybenzoate octaprenyltransferase [Verrucomicrobiales bacterium]
MVGAVRTWSEFVKLSHTIFALPFALASMAVAARENRGWPGWRIFLLIIGAMVTARTCAMAFNRIVDRDFDKENPRTAQRHLPAGKITLASAWTLWGLSAIAFLAICFQINRICFYLSPIALFVVCFYSFTKRFTDFTHVYLGIALALAPVGAWLAVTGSIHILPIVLALAVVCWLVGFDIIYAIQDYEFDRRKGLHSLVVRWGPRNALQFAFLVHLIMWGLLALFGLLLKFRIPYFAGLMIILGSLLLEHFLARRRTINWVNVAFFRLNALVSIVFLIATIVNVVYPGFRVQR